MVAIGIDLGTTNSCVAVWREGRVEIIANSLGNRITPSCVAFNDTERFIGSPAVTQMTKNPTNTVFDIKRLMGRRFADPMVQEDIKRWPFTVVDVGGKPRVQVEYKNETKLFAPEEISAMVLMKMKEAAEAYLDCEVTDAVITVPAYFNDAQRQATIDAGKIAGLNVLRIINEPTAAALAYGLKAKPESRRNILVYDLGGGTFDVSIVAIEEGLKCDVLATAGDTHLGGSDFDYLLVDHLSKEFQTKENYDAISNPKACSKLKENSEKAKISLTESYRASIDIDALLDGIDFNTKVTRAYFEDLCANRFKSTIKCVKSALKSALLKRKNIDDIVLVGGSTRIPMIQETLQKFFRGKQLKRSINPDEAVACGAAIQAAILVGDTGIDLRDLSFTDITSQSLGINVAGDLMSVVIPKNSAIPCAYDKLFTTSVDNQASILVEVFEGEELVSRDNNLLDSFLITGIPPAPAYVGSVIVEFQLNANGILKVTGVENITGNSHSIDISMKAEGLSAAEIECMKKQSEMYRLEDKRGREKDEALNQLEKIKLK